MGFFDKPNYRKLGFHNPAHAEAAIFEALKKDSMVELNRIIMFGSKRDIKNLLNAHDVMQRATEDNCEQCLAYLRGLNLRGITSQVQISAQDKPKVKPAEEKEQRPPQRLSAEGARARDINFEQGENSRSSSSRYPTTSQDSYDNPKQPNIYDDKMFRLNQAIASGNIEAAVRCVYTEKTEAFKDSAQN